MSKMCFCGTEEGCVFKSETDMAQHDKVIYEQGYNKAIEEFAEAIQDGCKYIFDDSSGYVIKISEIEEIADQLKKGGAT